MKYRIRDFLWLALAMGLGLGWFVDRQMFRKASSDWIDFDYQIFEPAGHSSRSGPPPFERTPYAFEAESRGLFCDEGLEEPSVDLMTASKGNDGSSRAPIVAITGCGGCFNR